MSEIDLYWDDDAETVMLAVVPARWTWDSFVHAVETAHAANFDPDSAFQAAIIDLSEGVNLPDPLWSPRTMHYARWTAAKAPKGTGPVVLVGVNRFVQSVFDPLKRMFPRATGNVHLVPNLMTARALVADLLAQESTDLTA